MSLRIPKRFKSINSTRQWVSRQQFDKFVQLRHRENYRCRSSYKLLEILKQYPQLLKPPTIASAVSNPHAEEEGNRNALDLGGSPGGWAQVLLKKKLEVTVVDKRYIEPLDNLSVVQADVNDPCLIYKLQLESTAQPYKCRLVTSDMAHNFTGSRSVDVPRMLQLVQSAYLVAEKVLLKNGAFVCKYLMGEDTDIYFKLLESKFEHVATFKPRACRPESAEQYFVCWGFKLEQ